MPAPHLTDSEAASIRGLHCSWQEVEVQGAIHAPFAMPRGVRLLRVSGGMAIHFQASAGETEAYAYELSSQLQGSAARLQGASCVYVHTGASGLSPYAASTSLAGMFRGLSPLAGWLQGLHLDSSPTIVQVCAAEMHALGGALAGSLSKLVLASSVQLQPSAWAALPAALPALRQLTVVVHSPARSWTPPQAGAAASGSTSSNNGITAGPWVKAHRQTWCSCAHTTETGSWRW